VAEVQGTITSNPTYATLLQKVQNTPTAYWIDTMAKIVNISSKLVTLKQAEKS
jgi:hypothetical protein